MGVIDLLQELGGLVMPIFTLFKVLGTLYSGFSFRMNVMSLMFLARSRQASATVEDEDDSFSTDSGPQTSKQ